VPATTGHIRGADTRVCRVETHLDARRFEIAPSKSVETNLDAADTSVRATQT